MTATAIDADPATTTDHVADAAGAITIHDRVVAKVAAQAAGEVPDVGAAAPRLLGKSVSVPSALGGRSSDLAELPKVSAQIDGAFAVVDLDISLRWPCSVRQVTEQLRAHVCERVREMTGLALHEVNIHVVDLLGALPKQPRVR